MSLFAFVSTLAAPQLRAQRGVAGEPPGDVPSILCYLEHHLGPRSTLIVDLRLRSGEANRAPGAADSAAAADAGGRVLHRFHIALLRVRVDTAGLRRLLAPGSGIADVAYPVADTTRLDVRLQAFFSRPVTPADTAALAARGGSLFRWPRGGRVVGLTAPDSAIGVLATVPDVTGVRAQAMACAIAN